MKILKPGTLPSMQIHKAKCRKCGCEFEFEEQEAVRIGPVDQRDSEYFTIRCPQKGCGQDVLVS